MFRLVILSFGLLAAIFRADAALSETARQSGVEAAWRACQPCRQKYDAYRVEAATKLAQGDVAAAAKAAMAEFFNMFGGTNIRVTSAGSGVFIWTSALKSNVSSQRVDLTLAQFNELLVGSGGQYDTVLENGIDAVVLRVAKSDGIRIEQQKQVQQYPAQLATSRTPEGFQRTGLTIASAPIPNSGRVQPPTAARGVVQGAAMQPEEEQPGRVIYRPFQPPMFVGKLTPAQERLRRSYAIFYRAHLDADENAKREAWLAEQEQRATEKEINQSKALVFPVGGR